MCVLMYACVCVCGPVCACVEERERLDKFRHYSWQAKFGEMVDNE